MHKCKKEWSVGAQDSMGESEKQAHWKKSDTKEKPYDSIFKKFKERQS